MLGDLDAARRGLAVAVAALGSVEGRRPRLFLGYTRALIAVAEGDDEAAAAELDATLAGEPIGPEIVDTLRVLLGVVYVLLPERRDELRSLPVGPDQRTAFAVAETFVRSREGVAPDRPVECEQALSVLGLRWTLELACRTDDAMATVLTDRFGPAVRDTLRAWAAEGRTGGSRAAGAATCLRTLPFPPAAAVYLRVLGPTTLERDGDAVRDPDWRRERVRSLLLLLVARRRISREVAATTLWPDLDAEAAGGNLRVTLRYLNKVLEPDRAAGDATWFVRAEGDALRLADEQLGVDAWELEAALDDAAVLDGAGAPSVALSRYEEALALWRGEYMADVYDDWAAAERDRLRSRFLAASVRSGELLLGTGDVDRALVVGTRAVEVEPWSEAAHRLVMAAHLARGDRAGARRALDRCAAALDELGVEPEEPTVMLERAILLPRSDG
jgi:DNA-binding SARP family transcriptional activator